MQEFTRVIGSIHRTGILSANCSILEYFIKTREGTLKKETKVSENQIRIFATTMCLRMCMYTHAH